MAVKDLKDMTDEELQNAWRYLHREDRQPYFATEANKADVKKELEKRGLL
jgi:hypothetical protein